MLNLTLFLALGLLVGTAEPPVTCTVSGIVTLRGKPLERARIIFHLDNDQFVGAKIRDGKYRVERVPPGRWKVTVEAEGLPARYASEEQSALMVEIPKDEPRQTVDLQLQKP